MPKLSRHIGTGIKKAQPPLQPMPWTWLLLPVAAALLAYCNTFGGEFLKGDDQIIIANNVYLKNWKYLPHFFTQSLYAGSGEISNFYRPFQLLLAAANTHLFPNQPWPYFLENILLHGLTGAMCAVLLYRLLPAAGMANALLCAAIWTVHPIAVEQIASATGLADPASMFWIMAAILAILPKIENRHDSHGFLSKHGQLIYLFCYVWALFSKESSVVLPPLALLLHVCLAREKRAGYPNFNSVP